MQRLRRPAQPAWSDATVPGSTSGVAGMTTGAAPVIIVPTRGRAESDTLTTALLNLAARGERPRCSDPVSSEMWLSEDQADRKQAARMCRGCPVTDPCREVGQFSTFGVFGGVDTTRRVRPGKKT